jgi:hypothetical protein
MEMHIPDLTAQEMASVPNGVDLKMMKALRLLKFLVTSANSFPEHYAFLRMRKLWAEYFNIYPEYLALPGKPATAYCQGMKPETEPHTPQTGWKEGFVRVLSLVARKNFGNPPIANEDLNFLIKWIEYYVLPNNPNL